MQKNLKEHLEAVGVLAVLIGLVFVGFELRQNTAAVQAATSQGLLEQSNQSNFLLATNPAFADLVFRGDSNIDDLSEVERIQYEGYILGEFNIWEQAFYAHADGTLSDRLWRGYDSGYPVFFCRSSRTEVWREIEYFFGTEFQEYVNQNLLPECSQ